jgi:cystathionine beta-lyase/cystathionine gamma-synthase
VIHLETPVNPTGRAFNVAHFAAQAHRRGAYLTVDATFAPPPLLDPFRWGADFVLHSGTKYFGGHSDLLCGVIGVGTTRAAWERDYWGMFGERVFLGAVMGSMEGWLGVRSLRTFELRVRRQSANAERLVRFLAGAVAGTETGEGARAVRAGVERIEHASLQEEDMGWLREQMPNGFGPVFSIWARSEGLARRLPSRLHLFHHATSLGGVESLIEWRKMSDPGVDGCLLRVSVGVEDWEDLKEDLVRGFNAVVLEV